LAGPARCWFRLRGRRSCTGWSHERAGEPGWGRGSACLRGLVAGDAGHGEEGEDHVSAAVVVHDHVGRGGVDRDVVRVRHRVILAVRHVNHERGSAKDCGGDLIPIHGSRLAARMGRGKTGQGV